MLYYKYQTRFSKKNIVLELFFQMDNIRFYNSFLFRRLSFSRPKHTDNSIGISCHFVGRMLRGSALIVCESGEEMALCAGDLFYLPLGLKYNSYWTPEEGSSVEWESYGFDFYPCKSGRRYVMQKLHPSERALEFLDHIDIDSGVSTSSIGLLYAFLGETFPTMKRSDFDPKRELFSKARHYIYQNTDFKVSDLARHCGMSESGLYAFFRSYANTTPIEEKNHIIVQKAITLLVSTDLTIESIATKLGVDSVAYLRKLIKAQTGRTPSEIRSSRFDEPAL